MLRRDSEKTDPPSCGVQLIFGQTMEEHLPRPVLYSYDRMFCTLPVRTPEYIQVLVLVFFSYDEREEQYLVCFTDEYQV